MTCRYTLLSDESDRLYNPPQWYRFQWSVLLRRIFLRIGKSDLNRKREASVSLQMRMKVLYLRPAGLRAGFGPSMLVNPGSRRQTVKKRHFCQPVTTYFLPDRGIRVQKGNRLHSAGLAGKSGIHRLSVTAAFAIIPEVDSISAGQMLFLLL